MLKFIKEWWHGTPKKYSHPFIGVYFKRHWTSKLVHKILDPIIKDPKWFFAGILMPIIAVLISFLLGRYL